MTGEGSPPAPDNSLERLIAAATGILAVISTAATAVATVAGGGRSVLINEPVLSTAALFMITAGTWIAFVGAILLPREAHRAHSWRWRRVRVATLALAAVLILLAIGTGLTAVTNTAARSPHPSVSAELSDDLVISGTARSAEDDLDSRLFLQITGWHGNPLAGPDTETPRILLIGQVGPTAQGATELPFRVRLPAGAYQLVGIAAWVPSQDPNELPPGCRDKKVNERVGCVSIVIPPPPLLPNIEVTINDDGRRTATVHVSGIVDASQHFDLLTRITSGPSVTSLKGRIVPDQSGSVDHDATVVLPDTAGQLCAMVTAVSDGETGSTPASPSCPEPSGDSTWSVVAFSAATD